MKILVSLLFWNRRTVKVEWWSNRNLYGTGSI